jgi:DNA-binding NtrC family response regulator
MQVSLIEPAIRACESDEDLFISVSGRALARSVKFIAWTSTLSRAPSVQTQAATQDLVTASTLSRTHGSAWLVRALSESPLTPVLIVGPEALELAKELHRATYPHRAPFVHVDCTWLPSEGSDEIVFGSERAGRFRRGQVDRANGGTLFFDDIAELPQLVQAQVATLIESMRFRRLGSSAEVAVKLRVVASVSRGVGAALKSGRLRKDLHARLSVFTIDETCSTD